MPPDSIPPVASDGVLASSTSGASGGGSAVQADHPRIVAFVVSQETETALREGLLEASPHGFEIHRGGVRAAMVALRKMPTPHTLIIDVSGEDQPLSALSALSDVVVPDVRVLVIGDRADINFYRQVTRGLGAQEYLYQPLMRDMVTRYFTPVIQHGAPAIEVVHGGRVITVTGARGGVGASTIAANLAWYFGVEAERHTVLLDADLHRGTAAMHLAAKTGPGLRTALEAPDRIDKLFVERAAQTVSKRLHILAGEEKLTDPVNYSPDAAPRLVDALRERYNFIVIDVPCSPLRFHQDLLMLSNQRVLVMDPTLASVRDTLRLLALPKGPAQKGRGVLVLNRETLAGGLTARQFAEGLGAKPDVVIPDLPKVVGTASSMGEAAMTSRGGFRNGILSLVREVAFVRVPDGAAPAIAGPAGGGGLLRRLFGRRS
jgi:pilus assembly protein CpaE